MKTQFNLAIASCAILLSAVATCEAQEPAGPSKEMDARAHRAAVAVIGRGAPMFNGGNREGCYRLYEGSLLALRAFVDGRPELVAIIDAKLDAAAAAPFVGDKAYALRAALDEVVKQCGGADRKPLWDRLGGEAGVRAVTQEFLRTAAPDRKSNIDRNGNYPLTAERVDRVEQLVVEFISSATGGPLKYTGRDMKNSHAGMKITQVEFDAAAGHLIAALKKYNVPQAEIDELVGLVAGVAKDIVEVRGER
jgi:hemoglobin